MTSRNSKTLCLLALASLTALVGCSATAAPTGGVDSNLSNVASSATANIEIPAADLDAARAALQKQDQLQVCTSLPYPPFQAANAEGKIEGFEVDLLQILVEKLGVAQVQIDMPFEGIKSGQALSTGRCDIAASGMVSTPERAKTISFSDYTMRVDQAILVKKGSSLNSVESLTGTRVGGQTSTSSLDYMNERSKTYGFTTIDFADLGTLSQAVINGQIDAAAVDYPVAADYLAKDKLPLDIGFAMKTDKNVAFGVKKDNTALLNVVDEMLSQLKADGTYQKLAEKWMGAKAPGILDK